jgi:hypothetical protein
VAGGVAQRRNLTCVDLTTGLWLTWSRPQEPAGVIGDVARAVHQRADRCAVVADGVAR